MLDAQSPARHRAAATALAALSALALPPGIGELFGAAPPATPPVTAAGDDLAAARQCRLEIELDPTSGRLDGEAVFEIPDAQRFLTDAGALPIALDARLQITAASIDRTAVPIARAAEPAAESARASWDLAAASAALSRPIVLRFAGVLREDVLAGEATGRIHNTAMRAHVGEDGIYLAPEAAWHPVLDGSRSAGWSEPDPPLCMWTIEAAAPVPLAASGDPVERAPAKTVPAPPGDQGQLESAAEPAGPSYRAWRTPFPQPAVAVAGGPLTSFERAHGAVTLRALLRAGSERHAPALLDAAASYLDLYQPLLGAYPFREFTVVENFFSSGFAFPGFTLLSSQVIQMGERGLRPGYLDHELLHNWWGHGVLASRSSGHWSEALASYCANYMRPLMEGRREQARAQRRSVAETLSGSPTLAGQAVGDFGRDRAVSNFVGYQKGAMVFDQLAARIGQERLWAGLRRFFRERVGRPSTWNDLRAAFEAESGLDLASFFAYWVDGPGLPSPRVEAAVWDGEAGEVHLDVAYSDPVPIELALRARFEDGAVDEAARTHRVTIQPGDTAVDLRTGARPVSIEVDPEFETLRLLAPELLMPTLSGLAPPLDLVVVGRAEDLAGYAVAAAAVEERYGKTGKLSRSERFDPSLLATGHVLVLGQAALDHEVARLFASEGVELWARGFAIAAVRYVSAGDAVLACVRNPRRAGAFVCLYWGNADEALERSHLLPFYGGNSLLVFDRGQPWKRRDFEAIERIEVR
jgi:hypothetical protein